MSQLDKIYALMADATPEILEKVRDRANNHLVGASPDGQGTSGATEPDTPEAGEPDDLPEPTPGATVPTSLADGTINPDESGLPDNVKRPEDKLIKGEAG